MNAEDDDHITLASKLLNSNDEQVAAAAKRIFADAFGIESSFRTNNNSKQLHTFINPQSCPATLIPSDIFSAASLLLAPKKLFEVTANRELTPDCINASSSATESMRSDPLAPKSTDHIQKRHVDEHERLNRR